MHTRRAQRSPKNECTGWFTINIQSRFAELLNTTPYAAGVTSYLGQVASVKIVAIAIPVLVDLAAQVLPGDFRQVEVVPAGKAFVALSGSRKVREVERQPSPGTSMRRS